MAASGGAIAERLRFREKSREATAVVNDCIALVDAELAKEPSPDEVENLLGSKSEFEEKLRHREEENPDVLRSQEEEEEDGGEEEEEEGGQGRSRQKNEEARKVKNGRFLRMGNRAEAN